MRFFSSVTLIAIIVGTALSAGPAARALSEPAMNGKADIRPIQSPSETVPGSDAESQAADDVTGAGREAVAISEALLQRPPARNDATLDDLFVRLGEAEGASEARGVVLMINRRWLRSGSDTADLLMTRARQAMRERDDALAVELLDRVIAMQPDWAEAWNRRAVAFHRLGDPLAAMADIHRTVTLEPRHFAAWAGLGHILREIGDEAGALASYEQALSLHPTMPRLEPLVETLRRELYGLNL
ncbi:MAG: Tetratricopeptide repeat/TPR repeat [Saliniramus fredricksonii]|jgi:tetratricopeptide (TPR) repeat protein|uniref:TPR repeat-containing protein n=1 Tax=Saliniramus fredricksonii TaxID=1653334 RepID=A0A0P7Y7X5_9HYPH|nr:hypothetical protein [Saliniramus fredricksonii]KPQ10320.1 MAG: Tetratricopeptide repeat/TPR repeat [Saliniramus fredricksonii]SCC79725.1 TPR repeat-containing protein [Saliniramus fredricksonii]